LDINKIDKIKTLKESKKILQNKLKKHSSDPGYQTLAQYTTKKKEIGLKHKKKDKVTFQPFIFIKAQDSWLSIYHESFI
jgi:predicted Zn-dependent protease